MNTTVPQSGKNPSEGAGVESIRILNVDDYEIGRYALSRVLRRAGFDVREAASGQEALDVARAWMPRLILLDVNLPDISGIEVCRTLKNDPETASITIVHVSATSVSNIDRVHGLNSGADGYITEPVAPEVLVATVNAFLRISEGEAIVESQLRSEREAREEAEKSNRAKDEFLATLSHELRTPMTSILGWVQFLRQSSLEPEGVATALATIEQSALAQAKLIDQILDASRMIMDKLEVETEVVEISSIVELALAAVEPMAQAKQVVFRSSIEPNVGTIRGDSNRLQQIVWNVTSNAIKFTDPGGRVDVSLHRDDGDAELVVRDTGHGIRSDFLPHVFERYRQSTSARGRGGLGIGLALVRHLVGLHGGVVTAASEGEGKGSTFTIRLPLLTE